MNSDVPIEKHTYDFLLEQIEALAEDDPLLIGTDKGSTDEKPFGFDLHRHPYQSFAKDKYFGIRISDATSDMEPSPGAAQVEEWDGYVVLIPFCRIRETDHSDYEDAVNKAFEIQKWVARLFWIDGDNITMNGRVRDARMLKGRRTILEINGALHAVANLPMLINDSGSGK